MRGKPKEPQRQTYAKTITIDSGDSLQKIVDCVESEGLKLSEARFEVHIHDSYECNCCGFWYPDPVTLHYDVPEDEKRWEQRLATYRKRLASWEEWAEEHKEEIENHLAAKAREKEEKLARLAERSRKALEREQKTLEKRLGNLKKRLQK